MSQKVKILDGYKHEDYILDIKPEGIVSVLSAWFTPIVDFSEHASLSEIEKCLVGLGFKKEES